MGLGDRLGGTFCLHGRYTEYSSRGTAGLPGIASPWTMPGVGWPRPLE